MTEITNILETIDKVQSGFDNTIDAAQKRMLNEVLTLSKEIEIKNGKVVSSIANLKLISKIKQKLNKAVVSKEYLKDVDKLVKGFDEIQSSQMIYFSKLSDGKTSLEKYNLVKDIAIDNTVTQLTESGIDANVTSKIKDILLRSVTSGGSYTDLVGEMTNFLSDNENGQGALKRYAQTYTNTALSQYAGQNNKLFTEEFKPKWYVYRGSLRETSREFCVHLEEKEYVHVSEFKDLIDGKIDGFQCEIYEKTGLPKGMIDGTSVDNLEVNCGGWNCNHKLIPVLDSYVPKNLREKFEKNNEILDPVEKKAEELKNLLISMGINAKYSTSKTDYGVSSYFTFYKDGNSLDKYVVRISDHSVSNTTRMQNERLEDYRKIDINRTAKAIDLYLNIDKYEFKPTKPGEPFTHRINGVFGIYVRK